MTGAVLGQAIPGFWLGLMLIYFFSVRLGWLPTGGTGGIAHFIMPGFGGPGLHVLQREHDVAEGFVGDAGDGGG